MVGESRGSTLGFLDSSESEGATLGEGEEGSEMREGRKSRGGLESERNERSARVSGAQMKRKDGTSELNIVMSLLHPVIAISS